MENKNNIPCETCILLPTCMQYVKQQHKRPSTYRYLLAINYLIVNINNKIHCKILYDFIKGKDGFIIQNGIQFWKDHGFK